jgi:tetratricopeptide (TPR) repeat protein
MADANGGETDQPAFKGPEAPCVYCGKVIDRGADRCPHCRTSYSFAVRKASREVVGDWFYLDSRNPSGRGVTFETLIKMIEKGRIKPDSIVRGPTTHHDWMYAAEAPRLAKYLGLCPHCFAKAKPEDTYCTECQLNMNERPAEARPGATPDEIQDPHHQDAYKMEERLAEAAKTGEEAPTPPPRPAPAGVAPAAGRGPGPRQEPKPSPMATAAAQALAGSGTGDRPSRVVASSKRSGPKLWIVLILTWVTLIPLFLLIWFVPIPFAHDLMHSLFDSSGGTNGAEVRPNPPPDEGTEVDQQWLKDQLARADAAEQQKDYATAIRIYEGIIERTGEESYRRRIAALRAKPKEERQARLDKLRDRLEMAEDLAAQKRYDDALAVLRNIGREDRSLLASLGIGVDNMEATIRAANTRQTKVAAQRQELAAQLAAAKALRDEGKLQEALAAYQAIQEGFDAALIPDTVDLASITEELKTEIAKAGAAEPPETTGQDPEPPPSEAATQIADLMAQAATLEKAEKFAEALAALEQIKEKFDQKFWPDKLEERIRQVKAKKEAIEFFGME